MNKAVVAVRWLLGLLLLTASVTFLFKLVTPPPLEGAMKTFTDGMAATGYMLPTVKVLELLCGLAFVTGRFVPLATVVLAPITVNIVLVHAFLDPKGLPVALFVLGANVFLAYARRDVFGPVLKAK